MGLLSTVPMIKDVMRSFADVLALFRTDTKIEGKTIAINQKALVAEMMFALNERYRYDIVLYDPGNFSPMAMDANGNFQSAILYDLEQAYSKRDIVVFLIHGRERRLATAKDELKAAEGELTTLNNKLAELEAALKKAKTTKEKEKRKADIAAKKVEIEAKKTDIDARKTMIARMEKELAELTQLVKDFDTLVAELVAVNEKTGASDLLTFLRAESLDLVLRDKSDPTKYREYYWLDINSVSAGGNNRTRKNLFRYIAGSKIDHSGGIIVEWQFLNPGWEFKDGGKLQIYEGYLTSRKIRDNRPTFSNAELFGKCGYPMKPPKADDDDTNIAKKN
jgi:hypothetical protein